MTDHSLVVVGDAMLDTDVDGTASRLSPDAPVPVLDAAGRASRPGGAALAAALAAGDGRAVTLVCALGDDDAGERVRALLAARGVTVLAAALAGATPDKVRFRAEGHPLLRVDRGGTGAPAGPLPPRALDAVASAAVVVVSDYGRGLTSDTGIRRALRRRQPTLWDPHPRGSAPVDGTTLVTPNLSELGRAVAGPTGSLTELAAAAEAARRRWRTGAVAATMGAAGALFVTGEGPPMVVPVEPVTGGDPCGAGDRFVTAVAGGLLDGDVLPEAVTDAVAVAGRFVAHGGATALSVADPVRTVPTGARRAPSAPGGAARPAPTGSPRRVPADDAERAAARVRAAGGRLVVAGGCFDLLHAGHVSLLSNARRLGDDLVVAVNSDASVRRLKGPGRPIVPEADRVAMLQALACVGAVAVFDEDTPAELLRRLRPDVFAKGADYSHRRLPEEALLAGWGGQVVVLPYLSGRSTTRLLDAAGTEP